MNFHDFKLSFNVYNDHLELHLYVFMSHCMSISGLGDTYW